MATTGRLNLFTVKQNWLLEGSSTEGLTICVLELVNRANREADNVYGVVFPQGPLDESSAKRNSHVWDDVDDLKIFISGTASSGVRSQHYDPRSNMDYGARSARKQVLTNWQRSIHRWRRLNKSQIRAIENYRMLDPPKYWWRKIDVGNRRCWFYVFRDGASLHPYLTSEPGPVKRDHVARSQNKKRRCTLPVQILDRQIKLHDSWVLHKPTGFRRAI
jgi:hypothetical protein